MTFTSKPPAVADAREWAAHAPVGAGRVTAQVAQAVEPKPSRPWEQLDPRAPASKAFNLRLNNYELELLRAVAEAEFASQQAVAKRILVRALQQAVSALK